MFPFLSDDDFWFKEGEKESMLKNLQQKLGKTRSELDLLFAELQQH